MDINQEITLSENKNNYKAIDNNKHLIKLNYNDYSHIYKELQFNESHIYADENDNINFVVKINNYEELKNFLYKKRYFTINKSIDGPILEIHIADNNKILKFNFSIKNSNHLFCIKQLYDKRVAYVHFLSLNKTDLIKDITSIFRFDDELIEYLKYTIDYCYLGAYPQIKFKGFTNENSFFIEIEPDICIIDKLSNIVTCLQKWGSKDSFDIYVQWKEKMKIYFVGNLINKAYIENEIIKQYKITSTGFDKANGIPYMRYVMGRLYYFEKTIKAY